MIEFASPEESKKDDSQVGGGASSSPRTQGPRTVPSRGGNAHSPRGPLTAESVKAVVCSSLEERLESGEVTLYAALFSLMRLTRETGTPCFLPDDVVAGITGRSPASLKRDFLAGRLERRRQTGKTSRFDLWEVYEQGADGEAETGAAPAAAIAQRERKRRRER